MRSTTRYWPWILLFAALGGTLAWMLMVPARRQSGGIDRGPLRHDVYVWQRAWTPEVQTAVGESAPAFRRVVVLGTQISWEKGQSGQPVAKIFRVKLPWSELRGREVGVAIRIGGYIGGLPYDGPAAEQIESATASLCAAAREAGVTLTEIQLDFDAAESKLDGYRHWVKAAQRGSGGVPVRITALPSWLHRPAFRDLARDAGGYVLQVHSLERPKRIDDPAALCDPVAARAAVEKAATLGVPFRVALPTYGYRLVFDRIGPYAGLEAEGEPRPWPDGARKRWLGADAPQLAGLVLAWQAGRPSQMEGIIWYRLPVASDRHNWRWPTLAAVMAGRVPQPKAVVACVRDENAGNPGLRDVILRNTGEDDLRGTMELQVTWDDATLLASDVLGGFEQSGRGDHFLRFRGLSGAGDRVAPGETRKIAWIRLDRDREVQGHVEESGR